MCSRSDPGSTITMGSGGSRNLRIVEPKANVTAFPSQPEYSVHIAAQPKILEEQLSHDREDESSEESSSQRDVEQDVSPTGTLRRYKMNYPEQAEDFQTMFENMQVLRNTMNNSSTRRSRYSKDVIVAILKLAAIHNDIRRPGLCGGKRSSRTVTKVR